MIIAATELRARATRYPELGYCNPAPGLWRIVDMGSSADASGPACVGPQYLTKAELLADLDRFAQSFGCA